MRLKNSMPREGAPLKGSETHRRLPKRPRAVRDVDKRIHETYAPGMGVHPVGAWQPWGHEMPTTR